MSRAVTTRSYNTCFQDCSGTALLAAADGDVTFVTNPNAAYSIFIQRIDVLVTTDAVQSASFEDSNSTPKKIFPIIASPGLGPQSIEFGDMGVQLTEGKNFVLNVSAAGLAMTVHWEGYMRPTAVSRTAANL